MCHVTVLRRSMGWIGRLASNCPFHIHLIHPNHFPFHPVPKPTFHRACDPTMLLSMQAVSSPWCYDAGALHVIVAVDRSILHGSHGRGMGGRQRTWTDRRPCHSTDGHVHVTPPTSHPCQRRPARHRPFMARLVGRRRRTTSSHLPEKKLPGRGGQTEASCPFVPRDRSFEREVVRVRNRVDRGEPSNQLPFGSVAPWPFGRCS